MNRKVGVCILTVILVMGLMAGCGQKEEEAVPYNYDLTEYVNVADYHDMPFATQVAEITDEDIELAINTRLENAATVENSTSGVVEDGDTINIAFAGRIDGELFDGGSSESYDLTVGTTPMIDGFVEGLVGKNVGETVVLDLQFPEEYHNADVAGKPVEFEITINSKRNVSVPEFNDEFVQSTSDFQTVQEYKDNLKEVLTQQAQEQFDANVKDALWQVILVGSEALQYPEEEMATAQKLADDMEAEYKNQATLYGLDWPTFLNIFMGADEEGFAQMKDDYAHRIVLSDMVLYKIARDENVSVTDSEFKEKTQEILAANNFTEESFQASYGMSILEYAENNGWKESFLLEKLMDKVIEYGREVPHEEFEAYVNETLGIEEEHDHEHDHEGETEPEGGEEDPSGTEGETEGESESDAEEGEGN